MSTNIDAETVIQYATWKPAKHVREAYRAAHQAAPIIERKPIKNQPPPPRPEPVDEEQRSLNDEAAQLPCAAGVGQLSRHWIPVTLTACVRCGREAADIINEANQLEVNA